MSHPTAILAEVRPGLDRARRALFSVILSLGLALSAQGLFARGQEDLRLPAALLYGAGTLCFILATRRVQATLPPAARHLKAVAPDFDQWLQQVPGRELALSLCVLTPIASILIPMIDPEQQSNNYITFVVWASGVVLLSLTLLPWEQGLQPGLTWLSVHRWTVLTILLFTAVGFYLRVYELTRIPYPMHGDEGSVGTEGYRILKGEITYPFATGWSSQPNLSFLPAAITLKVFGPGLFGLRMFPVLAGTLAVPLMYLLARQFGSRLMAALALIFLATYHFHIQFSRIAVSNITDTFFGLATFSMLLLGERKRWPPLFCAAGIFAGLAINSYAGARIIGLIAALYMLFLFATERRAWRAHLLLGGAFTFGFLVVAAPQLYYFAHHLDQFNARLNEVGMLQSGVLQAEMAANHTSAAGILWRQFVRGALAFNFYPARHFYSLTIPLLDFVSSIFFVLGLGFVIMRIRQPRFFLLFIWLLSELVLAGMLTSDAPNAERFILLSPLAALLTVLGMYHTGNLLAQAARTGPWLAYLIASALVIGVSLWGVNYYFGYVNPHYLGSDVNGEVGHELGLVLHDLGPNHRAYFFGPPRMYFEFPSIHFLAPNVEGEHFDQWPGDDLSWLKDDKKGVLIFLPEKMNELKAAQRALPGGRLEEVKRKPRPEETLFWLYFPNSPS